MNFIGVDDKHRLISYETLKRYNDKLHEELDRVFVKNERIEYLEKEIEDLKKEIAKI